MSDIKNFPVWCPSCKIKLHTSKSLRGHWLSEKHIKLSRDRWSFKSSDDKQSTLVVFPKRKLCVEKIATYFSVSDFIEIGNMESIRAPLPRDLVWWKDRSQSVHLEYESREAAESAFTAHETHFMKTENMILKPGYEMHDMDWFALFPIKVENKLKSNTKTELGSTPKKNESRKRPLPNEQLNEQLNGECSNQSKQIKTEEDNSECPVTRLNNYARKWGLEAPKFCPQHVGKKKGNKYICVAYVGGVERAKTCFNRGLCKTEEESIRRTAEVCLRNLITGAHCGSQVERKLKKRVERPVYSEKFEGAKLKTSFGGGNVSEEDWEEEWEENEPQNGKEEVKTGANGESVNAAAVDMVIDHVIGETSIKSEVNGDPEGTSQQDEIMEACPSPTTSSAAPPEEDPDWQIKLLENMAQLRGWDPPFFRPYRMMKKGNLRFQFAKGLFEPPWNAWRCRVSLNNVEYQPDPYCDMDSGKQEAIRKAALECLKIMLESESTPGGNEFAETFKIPIEPTIPQLKTEAESTLTESISSNPPLPPFADECARLILESYSCLSSQDSMDSFLALQVFLKSREPACSAGILTSWNQNPNSKEVSPLIHISNSGPPTVTMEMIKNIFQNGENPQEEVPFVLEGDEENRKLKVKLKSNGATLTLVPSADNYLEIQTYRLLEYLCTFDVRVLPLLTVVQYWAAINSVEIGEAQNFGDLMTLQWLIILFLCHKGILPTPREIQRRPHAMIRDPVTSADLGFTPDRTFAKSWSIPEAGAKKDSLEPVEIFQLFSSFLHFFVDQFMKAPVIVNVRDCEVIDKEKFCNSIWNRKRKAGFSALSTELRLKEIKEFQDMCSKRDFTECQIYVTNPFIATWEFKISNSIKRTFEVIMITGNRLSKLLKDYSDNQKGTRTPENEEDSLLAMNLKEMLKVDYEDSIAGTSANGHKM